MIAMHFVDTNILVYGFDDSDSAKRDRAQLVMRCLWETRNGRLSHQVLHEFYVTVTRKLKPSLPRAEARTEVEDLLDWKPLRPSAALLKQAWQIEDRHGFSWWDSLIIAAAIAQDCTTLLTEDLQHGLQIDNLRVVNPFRVDFQLDELST
jgi:predicted nucleic acid-binding protein